MTDTQLQENIDDNLVRLRRQYDICSSNYDRPALKDLAHVLRIWMDMSREVDYYILLNKPKLKFNSFGIKSEFNRVFRGDEYLVVSFPKGVNFYDSENSQGAHVYIDSLNRMFGTTWDYRFDNLANGKRRDTISCFISVYRDVEINEKDFNKLNCSYIFTNRTSFKNWLSSMAIRVKRFDNNGILITYDISRELMVRRVANILGGSHPEGGVELENKYDPIIKELLGNKIFKIPLPHLVLLKIAQDILQAF